jgi:hypothetical protein
MAHRRKHHKAYGAIYDESTSTPTLDRIGQGQSSPAAAKLPDNLMTIQSLMKRCVISDAGAVQYYLDSSDSTLKENGDPSALTGADGQVMVEVPQGWLKYWYANSKHHYLISKEQFNGASRLDAFYKNDVWVKNRYMSAYEGILYDVSASQYTNGVYQPAHNVGFISGSKTIIHRTGTVKTVNMTGAVAGTGYQVNDVLTLAGGTAGATITVATIGGGGEVLTITLTTKGYGYTAGVKATSGGTGSNCTVNIATLETAMTNPYTKLEIGDKITISSSVSNNNTFTVASGGDQFFTVDEAVTDEDYASEVILQTQKNWTASTGDKLSSVSGKAGINQGTRSNFRAVAKNRGTGWRQQDYDLVSAIQLFYLVEYASWYSQSMIGNGLTNFDGTQWLNRNNYNPIETTGLSNSLGNVSGGADNGVNALGSYMSYRGIENFYGHLWGWVDGINIGGATGADDHKVHVCNNDVNFADNTWTNYTDFGIVLPNSHGWQLALEQIARGFLPASVGGDSNTYITDYYYQNIGWRVARLSAGADSGADAGVAYWHLYYSSGYVNRFIAGRLSY